MNALVILLLPAVALGLGAPDSRIVNGQDVDIANFPWQGSYRTFTNSHSCGCVFVGGNWVLTAGHCGGSSSYSMEFGSSNRGSGSVFSVSSVTRHPNYDQGNGFTPNDIAVVRASSSISGANISPGSLPSSANNPGGQAYITGWGRTCGLCGIPVALQGAELNVISDSECTSIHGASFDPSVMICVYNGESGACSGDSGGPMSVGSTIYGLTSWGIVGCPPTFPSVYAKVGAFREWVCSQTSNGASGC